MNEEHIKRIDLNLLWVFNAIMAHRKLTAAAEQLGLTQPAVSHALARLRTLLGDELFLRTRIGVEPTPRALEIEPIVETILEAVSGIMDRPGPFEPSQASGQIRIGMLDGETAVLAGPLDRLLAEQAPGVQLVIRHAAPEEALRLIREGDLDLGIGVIKSGAAEIVVEPLYEDSMAVIARRDHPRIHGALSLPVFTECSHVDAGQRPGAANPIDAPLQRMGQRRRVALTVPYVTSAAQIVAMTDRLATLPRRVSQALATSLPLQVQPVPLTVPGSAISMGWHRRRTGDRLLEWARDRLQLLAKGNLDGRLEGS